MGISLRVNTMSACFLIFLHARVEVRGGGGVGSNEEPGARLARFWQRDAARRRRQSVDSCCITLLGLKPTNCHLQ